MKREQAINYLFSCGFTNEQVGEVVRALTYEPTTKNDLGVDCISRADAIKAMQNKAKKLKNEDTINGLCGAVAILYEMPSVTPQEPQTFKWCTDCKEYDQEKHCCHRWSKVIRDAVEEMKQEQEPKSEWEHDHEILKAYADGANEVLDKLRAEIDKARFIDKDTKICKNALASGLEVAMQIIDKYKAEAEAEDGNVNN